MPDHFLHNDASGKHPDREPWHISRAVSITHILSTLTIIGVLFTYFTDIKERVSNAELNIYHLQQNQINDRQASEKRYDDFRTDLRTINQKLDRLIEYQSRGNER